MKYVQYFSISLFPNLLSFEAYFWENVNELLAGDLGSMCLWVSIPLVIATWRVEQFYTAKLCM